MFPELRKHAKTAGQPPGMPIYTGTKTATPSHVTVIVYSEHDFHETTGKTLAECVSSKKEPGTTWVNVTGLNNTDLMQAIAEKYQLHPLTVEDILNVDQRSKIEEFEKYHFISIKMLQWQATLQQFTTQQFSLVLGKNFVLTFQESENTIFDSLHKRLRSGPTQRLRQQGSDYLAYRLMDTIVDQYFLVLEGIADQIEAVEESIISNPTQQASRTLYRLKRQLLMLRKGIWPMREVLGHLLREEEEIITPFTRVYLRDVYDHVSQALDTVETFRDMVSGLLDIYLSSLSNRMNEIMKVLTIIATIFIPITFISSLYGMNFTNMPELHWRWGYPAVLGLMVAVTAGMLFYFRRKKWI